MPTLCYSPNAYAEVWCGAKWDGTPRCQNWLGQEVDIKYRKSIREVQIILKELMLEKILSKNVLIFLVATVVKVIKFLNV